MRVYVQITPSKLLTPWSHFSIWGRISLLAKSCAIFWYIFWSSLSPNEAMTTVKRRLAQYLELHGLILLLQLTVIGD